MARHLTENGFTHCHLANNHILDAGPGGLQQTIDTLREQGLEVLGAAAEDAPPSGLTLSCSDGLRIGWLACGRTGLEQPGSGPTFWELDRDELLSAVRASRTQADVLIVSLHLGYMFVDYPDPEHRVLALALAQAGADLVLMHHPHVLQGIEVTDSGSVICYSLGNFLFDWEEGEVPTRASIREQQEGAIFVFDLDLKGVAGFAVVPTVCDEDFTVRFAGADRGHQILSRIERLSQELVGDYTAAYRRQRASRNTRLGLAMMSRLLKQGRLLELGRVLCRARMAHLGMLVRWMLGPKEAS